MASRTDDDGAALAGSQLQTQLYVNRRRELLDAALREALPDLAEASFSWRSPLESDKYREYYGASFLRRLELDDHADALNDFWPTRGPQWDALALVQRPGEAAPGILLVEGKSYPAEMLNGAGATSADGSDNRKLIEKSLAWTQHRVGVRGKTPQDWCGSLYQNANRLAHVYWLRERGVQAWFVHLLFTDDPQGPTDEAAWEEALAKANEELGIDGLDLPGVAHVCLPAGTRDELVGEEVNPDLVQADAEDARHLPEGLMDRLRSDPARAPEYLALAAVDRWGQQARDYAQRAREQHPEATPRQLADVVKSRHALLARMEGAAAGLPGTVVPLAGAAVTIVPDLAALAWIQSRMVVQIAAVYGHDTNDREMAAEILVLQGIYNTTEAARVALAQAGKRVARRLIERYIRGSTLVLLRNLFRYVGIRFTRTGLLKAVPFIAVPINAAVNEMSTRSLANKAIKYYDTQPRSD